MAKPGPKGKRHEIAAEFAKRFPDGNIPRGALTEIAEAVGLSKPRVSILAREMGLYGSEPPERSVGPCEACGRPMRRPKRICEDCRTVNLVCDACGKPFTRARDRVLEKQNDPRYRGRTFCSWTCFNSAPRRAASHAKEEARRR
jgi:hypothetical protein